MSEGVDVVVFDLDGTLIRVHTLDLLRAEAAARPDLADAWRAAVRTSKQAEKVMLFGALGLDVAALPFRTEVLALLRIVTTGSCETVLATGSSQELASAVAGYLGGFDRILGTTEAVNLTGPRKASALEAAFSGSVVWYIGDSPADVAVWRSVDGGLVVGGEMPDWMPPDLTGRVSPLAVEDA
jgi:phosphoserine phosphatase